MSVGVVLVGIGVILVVAAYLARPFRMSRPLRASYCADEDADLDCTIEAWVARARARREHPGLVEDLSVPLVYGADVRSDDFGRFGEAGGPGAAYCPQCGRRAGPGDRFCARCGTPLQIGDLE
jgi:hypothetical protein